MPDTIIEALRDASWRVDRSNIPPSLNAAWKAVESKQYASGAKAIRAAVKSQDKATKTAAKELLDVTMADMKRRGKEAWDLGKTGDKWQAFIALNELGNDFEGFNVPKKVVAARDSLAGMPEIQNEVKANKMFTAAVALVDSGEKRKIASARKRFESLIKRFPDTQKAQQAQEQINKIAEMKK